MKMSISSGTSNEDSIITEHRVDRLSSPAHSDLSNFEGHFHSMGDTKNRWGLENLNAFEDEENKDKDMFGYSPRRKYEFNARRPCSHAVASLRKRRINAAHAIIRKDLKLVKCCKTKQCFKRANASFLSAKITYFAKVDNNERRNGLRSMLRSEENNSRKYFSFDGKRVCASFLSKAFRFSRDLQSSIKQTPASLSKELAVSCTREIESCGRDSIITFLERLARKTAGKMPDKLEQHLPFFKKSEVYVRFMEEHALLHLTVPPSPSYFYKVWKTWCNSIKVRKVSRFAKCDVCEELRAALLRDSRPSTSTKDLLLRRKRHVDMVARERREYQRKKEDAILQPGSYCSICIDGADQSAFGLPHFAVNAKSTRGRALKVKLVGLLEHGPEKRLYLYTMTEEFETGANHIIECLHRFINDRSLKGRLPSTLYIQLDNCSRENKNRYFLSFLESLVAWNVFEEIHASFLPVGHTHIDIDQSFSCTSRRLRSYDAITLTDLHRQLRASFTPPPIVNHIRNVVNFSGLCKQEKNIAKLPKFTHFRYFRFNRASGGTLETGGKYKTICHVKILSNDPWVPFDVQEKGAINCFLVFAPDLQKTPQTAITCPDGEEEVEQRFRSEEGRINCSQKMADLRILAATVYTSREEEFHWNLSNCVEARGIHRHRLCKSVTCNPDKNDSDDEENVSIDSLSVLNRYGYEINMFVSVRPAQFSAACPFWIGKVCEIVHNREGVACKLDVHWYQPSPGKNPYICKYTPAYLQSSPSCRKPWRDLISTDSVIVEFERLTRKNELTATVQKILRNHVVQEVG